MPEEFDDFATCHETNGVGWFIPDEQVTGSPEPITMTTIGRDVNIEVALPVRALARRPTRWSTSPTRSRATTEEVDGCV